MLQFALLLALTLPPPEAPRHGSAKLGIAVFLAGQTADLGTTIAVLHRPHTHESNRLYGPHPSNARLILTTAAITVPVALLIRALAPEHPKIARWLGVGLGGVGFSAAAYNSRALR